MTPKASNSKLETRNSKPISSRDNSLLRRARAVRDGRIDDLIFVEGLRLCEEAVRSGLQIDAVIYSKQIARKPRAADLIENLHAVANTSAEVSERLLESISDTKTPQGIVVLAARPAANQETFTAKQPGLALVVMLHEINNPVNVGAIVRVAEAAGASGIIATEKTADPFTPSALRGAMGSAFRLPMWCGATFDEVILWCTASKMRTVAADVSAPKDYTAIDWRKSRVLIVGRESTGISPAELAAADEAVRIPMQGAAESLNVAVATGVILFEAARQRAQK